MFKSFPDVKTAGDMVNRVTTLCIEGGESSQAAMLI